MASISENDQKTWDDYVSNFENYRVNINGKKKINHKSSKIIIQKHVSSNNFKLLKKGKIKPDYFIDLHGYRLYSAKRSLHKFIMNAYENNIRNILIIPGKGQNNSGVLRKEVPIWLNEKFLKQFLIDFSIAPKSHGGGGALIVRIKNKYKN